MSKNRPARQGQQDGQQQVRMAVKAVQFSGPLPHPDIMKGYEEISPGFASRIISLAEQQSSHRQRMEELVLRHEGRRSWGGLAAGWTISLAALAAAVWMASQGHPWPGSVIATVDLAALAGVFVFGRRAGGAPPTS